MTAEQWAYVGGLIDADGSIGMYSAKSQSKNIEAKNYYLRLNITNNSVALMEWLTSYYGGTVTTQRRRDPRHSDTYTWCVTQVKAGEILRRCRTHMIVKVAQADLAIEYMDNFQSATSRLGMSPAVRALRKRYWLKMSRLKGTAGKVRDVRSRRD